jgi:hypothetical protein
VITLRERQRISRLSALDASFGMTWGISHCSAIFLRINADSDNPFTHVVECLAAFHREMVDGTATSFNGSWIY